jgi:hypothetical protein
VRMRALLQANPALRDKLKQVLPPNFDLPL